MCIRDRFGDVASFAIRFARDGFAVYAYLAQQITENADRYARWQSSAAIFLPGGRPPVYGERFVQTELAGMLQYMVDAEAGAGGDRARGLAAARAAFYE